VTASAGQQRVTIRWSSPSVASTFTVKRSLTSGGPYFPISVPGQFTTPTSYVDSGLTNGISYFYVVSASNQFGSSGDSSEAAATPGFKPLKIASGIRAAHSLAILPDRTVWAWGSNSSGQLGSGTSSGLSGYPRLVEGLDDVSSVAAGYEFSLALRSDGRVWAWGSPQNGALGDGGAATSPVPLPQPVPTLDNVVTIAAGSDHALCLKSDGSVWGWGANDAGQTGNGSIGGSVSSPVPVAGLTEVKAIAAGWKHSLAVKQDGTVWGWGDNATGELGINSTGSPEKVPVQVQNLTGITAVSAGENFSAALRSDGTVWAWGNNELGTIGNGEAKPFTRVLRPSMVINLTEVTAISSGFRHTLALRVDGTIWGWGSNTFGALGNNGTPNTPYPTPVQVLNVGNAVAIAASIGNGLCLDGTGILRAWGTNGVGEVGNGTAVTQDLPIPLLNMTNVTVLAPATSNTMVLRDDGTVWGWGTNNYGQLGFGPQSFTAISAPNQVLTGVASLAAGNTHTIALKTDGTVWTWGNNQFGQMGKGATSAPVLTPSQVPGLANILSIAAGGTSCYAVQSDGSLVQWGDIDGVLGSAAPILSPTLVTGFNNIKTLAPGWAHIVALKNDGTVWAWGENAYGQVGPIALGPTVAVPTLVQTLPGADDVAAGVYHSLAVLKDHTVCGWGSVSLDGSPQSAQTPPGPVIGLSGAKAVSAGNDFSLVFHADGSVRSWGMNDFGQLGIGDETNRNVPTLLPSLTNAVKVAAGHYHGTALMPNGTITVWGYNTWGQLGVPMLNSVPIAVVITP
jgi:alpha-tubulin suppressor-like RCC1 family protein